ncbi:unnamed protein product [Discula destructiva]
MKSAVILSLLASLAASVPVFSTTTFNEISIAGGTAGNGEQKALDALAGLPADLTTVDPADINFLDNVNGAANDAEVNAYNPAIEAASGEQAAALQRAKIENKIFKLEATVLKLQIQEAQGEDVAAKLAEEQTKLNNNIALDQAEAGNPSTAVPFDAEIVA